ncbi:hypothetical protein M0Q50_07405 [bacterium]|jgi:hypothetical protein|nr:hypothetical protein [bacterium]
MYNKGDIIICKCNKGIENITINKSYTIMDIDINGIQIYLDNDFPIWFDFKKEIALYRIIADYFYSKTELRKIKLNTI